MRNVKVIVEYDGTDFFGFQKQPARRTVQGTLEWALAKITKEPVNVVGAGRTDAGVHALGQVISFKTSGSIPTDRVSIALNSLLPRDVVAKGAEEVSEDFHARFSATSRLYRYQILNGDYPSAICGRFVWYHREKLDLESMREAAKALIGRHDFASFAMADAETRGTERDLFRLSIERCGDLIACELEANAFLHSMARIIVGTLVEVGDGRREPREISEILQRADRNAAGKTAPACGLILVSVRY